MKRALSLAAVIAVSAHLILHAQGLSTGRNVNITPGKGADQFTGDLYLQRKVEPKAVCASNGPQNCLAIANDYRWVDGDSDIQSGFGEGLASLLRWFSPKSYLAATPDAWLGLYRTSNGGESWVVGGVPGFPEDISDLGMSQPWSGLGAGSDGGLATDGIHFYGVGLFFNRGGTSMIGAFRLTNYNDESKFPIRWDAGYSRVLEQGSATAGGLFADLPSIITDPQAPGTAPGCGMVYAAYTFFAGAPTNNSFINFTRSSDCGLNWSKPMHIPTLKKNQRVVLTVNPKVGTPTTNGGGTLWAIYRTFGPDMIVGTRSLDYGKTWSSPVPISALSGPSTLCTYDQPTIATTNDSIPENQTARALAFAWPAFDSNGKLHVVWPERVNATTGLPPASPGACTSTLQPKIVYTSSVNGAAWTPRKAVDMGDRCETVAVVGQAARLDKSVPNGTMAACPANTVGRFSGPQLQPVLTHNAGKLMLLYDEGRKNPDTNKFLNASGLSNGYHAGRNTQMDVRAAQIGLDGTLLSTAQVSRYIYDVKTNDIKTVDGVKNPAGAKAYNRPYLPQYKKGTTPFKGDHEHMTPAEEVVWGSPPHFATPDEVPGARFFTIWGGDTREGIFPFDGSLGGGNINGSWTDYANAGGGTASPCNAGMRYSNNYWAYVGPPTDAFVHQSFKPPSGFQHTWAVTVRNRRSVIQSYKFLLEETGTGGSASFHQELDVDTIGNTPTDPFCAGESYPTCTSYRQIPPHSSMTFTVFGQIQDGTVAAPIKVKIFEANTSVTPATETSDPVAIVRLNPNNENPAPVAGGVDTPNTTDDIASHEHHGPAVQGPFVKTNPTQGGPTQGAPTQGAPGLADPTQGAPTQGATGFGDYTDYTYKVKAANANTLTQYSSFANIANPDDVDDSHIVQMIITRPHKIATLNMSPAGIASGCPQQEYLDDEIISTITFSSASQAGTPTQGGPTQGGPTQGGPTQGGPTQGASTPLGSNPTQGGPTQGANTFALSPQNTPLVGTSAAAAYRATAIASALAQAVSSVAASTSPADGTVIGNPDTDEIHVTLRFWHCDKSTDCNDKTMETPAQKSAEQAGGGTVPWKCAAELCAENEPASNLIGFIAIAGPGDNDEGVITPPKFDSTGPDLFVSFPATLTATPSTIVAGDSIQIDGFTITNGGDTTAGAFSHRFFLAPSTPLTGSISTPGSAGLGAGQSVSVGPTNVVIPTHHPNEAPVTPGTYLAGPLIDDTNAVTEGDESNNFKAATIIVCASPTVTTSSLPNGTAGQTYSQSLAASGGKAASGSCGSPTFSWTKTAGALPQGLTLSSTGAISGTPTASGTFNCTVQATDETSHSATRSLSITIAPSGTGGVLFVASDVEEFADVFGSGPDTPPDRLGRFTTNGTSVTGTILSVPYRINSMAEGGGFLYAGDPVLPQTLRKIDYNGNLLSSMAAPFPNGGNGCCNEEMAFDGTYLFHANHNLSEIERLDPSTGAVLETYFQSGPVGMTFVGSTIWITHWSAQEVGTWDPVTNTFTRKFSTPTSAGGLAYDSENGILWVGRKGGWVEPYNLSGTLLAPGFQPFGSIPETIDGLEFLTGIQPPNTVIASVPISNHPAGVAANPATNRTYVVGESDSLVSVIDGTTNTVAATIPLGASNGAYGVAVNSATNRIYVARRFSNDVAVIDGPSNTVMTTVPLPLGVAPFHVAVNSTTNRIYVSNQDSNNVSVIDGELNTVIATIPIASSPGDIAVNAATDRIYVVRPALSGGAGGNLVVIDGLTNLVVTTINFPGLSLAGVTVNSATNRIYVSHHFDNQVSVVDGATDTVLTAVTVGAFPLRLGANSATNRIYVSNFDAGTVSVINGATNAIVATVTVGSTPYFVAANTSTKANYVGNFNGNYVSVIK